MSFCFVLSPECTNTKPDCIHNMEDYAKFQN